MSTTTHLGETPRTVIAIDQRPRSRSFWRRLLSTLGCGGLVVMTGGLIAGEAENIAGTFEQQVRPFLQSYCVECHGTTKPKADLDLVRFTSSTQALAAIGLWGDSGKRVHGHDMPPTDARKQPSDAERAQFVAWTRSLRRLSPKDPGPASMRRLSSLEYANTLRDLLGVDPAVAEEIPQDQIGAGFSSALPPLLMEKYLLVADAVLDDAIVPDQLQLQWNAGQLDAVIGGKREEGTANGTQRRLSGPAEVLATISAPVDGTYTIRIRAGAEKLPTKDPAILAVRVDGQLADQVKVTAAAKTPGAYTAKAKLLAGKSTLSVLLANPVAEVPAAPTKPGAATTPNPPATTTVSRTVVLDRIEVIGPPSGRVSDVQRRLIIATPSTEKGRELSAREAAKRIAVAFAPRAFRRPVTEGEIETLLKVFDLADSQGEVFANAVKLMLKAVLVSPAFLHLTPDGPPAESAAVVAVGPFQLASQLSYLFWATMPDAELTARAADGTLVQPTVLEAQIRRLIADPRSRVLFRSFGASWLGVDRLATMTVDEKKYPQMTKDLRRAMYDEVAALFDGILRENRSLIEFVDCDYTYLNASLAKLYGMESAVKGPQLTRVTLSDRNRGGVLTLPGVLAATSHATRTSPVKRGAWVLDQILGQAPPPPPMNVPQLEKQDTSENARLNLRQRTERHRADPACVSCHRTIDPIGFGLENFDGIGRWRDRDDTGNPIDASGNLPGGAKFSSPAELKRLIAEHRDDLCRALVAKVLSYALCRALTGYDEVVADDIAAAVAADGYRFQTVWVRVAMSYPFLNRRIR